MATMSVPLPVTQINFNDINWWLVRQGVGWDTPVYLTLDAGVLVVSTEPDEPFSPGELCSVCGDWHPATDHL
jgi:hypothetical protein